MPQKTISVQAGGLNPRRVNQFGSVTLYQQFRQSETVLMIIGFSLQQSYDCNCLDKVAKTLPVDLAFVVELVLGANPGTGQTDSAHEIFWQRLEVGATGLGVV